MKKPIFVPFIDVEEFNYDVVNHSSCNRDDSMLLEFIIFNYNKADVETSIEDSLVGIVVSFEEDVFKLYGDHAFRLGSNRKITQISWEYSFVLSSLTDQSTKIYQNNLWFVVITGCVKDDMIGLTFDLSSTFGTKTYQLGYLQKDVLASFFSIMLPPLKVPISLKKSGCIRNNQKIQIQSSNQSIAIDQVPSMVSKPPCIKDNLDF
ncbi:hypothetical protein M9H77_14480 [Catharanthus roseus]|uniref:Uncharacterized protein n=1 Tax=Catharanthus roseus TaxID=4058 RepID=A0ACC0BN66_CATRO|nr:hypothetical protein M9H77_14480 [Catharanthus roseus]